MQQDLDVGAPPGLGFPPAWFPEAAVQDRKAQGRSEGAAANVPLTCLDEAQGLAQADCGGGGGVRRSRETRSASPLRSSPG